MCSSPWTIPVALLWNLSKKFHIFSVWMLLISSHTHSCCLSPYNLANQGAYLNQNWFYWILVLLLSRMFYQKKIKLRMYWEKRIVRQKAALFWYTHTQKKQKSFPKNQHIHTQEHKRKTKSLTRIVVTVCKRNSKKNKPSQAPTLK